MIKKLRLMALLLAFFTIQAYSYIDPGTGSYVIQVLIAVFVGASVGVKIFWRRIKDFLTGTKTVYPEKKDDQDDDDSEESDNSDDAAELERLANDNKK